VGIGFAIPINEAKTILPQLEAKGHVKRGWLGVSLQPMTAESAKAFKLKPGQGALVADVMPNSPAAKAGITPGDVIGGRSIGSRPTWSQPLGRRCGPEARRADAAADPPERRWSVRSDRNARQVSRVTRERAFRWLRNGGIVCQWPACSPTFSTSVLGFDLGAPTEQRERA